VDESVGRGQQIAGRAPLAVGLDECDPIGLRERGLPEREGGQAGLRLRKRGGPIYKPERAARAIGVWMDYQLPAAGTAVSSKASCSLND
jgi:hypothetical protein